MIPNGYRFIGIAPEVDLKERGSALLNKRTEPFTLDEIRGYKVFTALLTQSGGDDPDSTGAGPVTEGVTYLIDGADGTDDFSNVGGPAAGTGNAKYFIAINNNVPNSYGDADLIYNIGAPVATVLENTIGNIWWEYQQIGEYLIKSNDLFTQNKTILFASSMNNGNDVNNHTATIYANAPSELTFASWGNTGDNQQELDNSIPLPIEIRVYS